MTSYLQGISATKSLHLMTLLRWVTYCTTRLASTQTWSSSTDPVSIEVSGLRLCGCNQLVEVSLVYMQPIKFLLFGCYQFLHGIAITPDVCAVRGIKLPMVPVFARRCFLRSRRLPDIRRLFLPKRTGGWWPLPPPTAVVLYCPCMERLQHMPIIPLLTLYSETGFIFFQKGKKNGWITDHLYLLCISFMHEIIDL